MSKKKQPDDIPKTGNIVGDVIHEAIRHVAQRIYDEYGVQIEYAMIGWEDGEATGTQVETIVGRRDRRP